MRRVILVLICCVALSFMACACLAAAAGWDMNARLEAGNEHEQSMSDARRTRVRVNAGALRHEEHMVHTMGNAPTEN